MCQLSQQWGILTGAIPLSCPLCPSVYLKHRDYSCSSCQQRASFRLSLLHSMTSAEPSHLQHKTHNEGERTPPHAHKHRENKTNTIPSTTFMPKCDTMLREASFKTDLRFSSAYFSFPAAKVMRRFGEAPPASFQPPPPAHTVLFSSATLFPHYVSLKCSQVEE